MIERLWLALGVPVRRGGGRPEQPGEFNRGSGEIAEVLYREAASRTARTPRA